jgi:hypothetical protein
MEDLWMRWTSRIHMEEIGQRTLICQAEAGPRGASEELGRTRNGHRRKKPLY